LEMYFHDRLAPELMALAYSIESIRAPFGSFEIQESGLWRCFFL